MELDDVEPWKASVVAACEMAWREGNHCLHGRRCVVVFDLDVLEQALLQEMVVIRV
jgi:hypothetical protein